MIFSRWRKRLREWIDPPRYELPKEDDLEEEILAVLQDLLDQKKRPPRNPRAEGEDR